MICFVSFMMFGVEIVLVVAFVMHHLWLLVFFMYV